MAFVSDKQRKGFFGSRGNVRSNVNPNLIGKSLVRSKTRFPSIRQAWIDIGKKTGIKPNQVKPDHTGNKWIWKLKK